MTKPTSEAMLTTRPVSSTAAARVERHPHNGIGIFAQRGEPDHQVMAASASSTCETTSPVKATLMGFHREPGDSVDYESKWTLTFQIR